MTQVHQKTGCELPALHLSGRTAEFIKQWATANAVNTSFSGKPANRGLGG